MTPALILQARKNRLNVTAKKFPYTAPRIAVAKDESLDKPWYVEYYAWSEINQKLKRKRLVLNQPTKKERIREGRAAAREILHLLQQGYIVDPRPNRVSKTVASDSLLIDALEAYLKHHQQIMKKSTHDSYRTITKRFKKSLIKNQLGEIALSNYTTDHAREFSDELSLLDKISNRTRNNTINGLVTIFNYFIKRKAIQENPFSQLEMLPALERRHTAFTPQQAADFKAACAKDPQLWIYTQFMYYAFIRPLYELRYLKVKDIRDKTIQVQANNAKNSKSEHVMIPAPLEALITKHRLRQYDPDHYVFGKHGIPGTEPTYRNQLYRRHRKILIELELHAKHIDMYSWKHTGVIALWNATQNMQLIRQQCRHSDLMSTMKYLRDLGLFTDYEQINQFPEL